MDKRGVIMEDMNEDDNIDFSMSRMEWDIMNADKNWRKNIKGAFIDEAIISFIESQID